MIGAATSNRNDVVDLHMDVDDAARRALPAVPDLSSDPDTYLAAAAEGHRPHAAVLTKPIRVSSLPISLGGFGAARVGEAPPLRSRYGLSFVSRIVFYLGVLTLVMLWVIGSALSLPGVILVASASPVFACVFFVFLHPILKALLHSFRIGGGPFSRSAARLKDLRMVTRESAISLSGFLGFARLASAVDNTAWRSVPALAWLAGKIGRQSERGGGLSVDDFVHNFTVGGVV